MSIENRIGYACTPISIPYRTSRGFLLKNFSADTFNECVKSNIEDLMNILKWNMNNDIYLFRISSDIIPFGSHPVNNIPWEETFKDELSKCGKFICSNNIRVSMHPGQYTVLNSPNEEVAEKSIKDLEYHCRFLDAIGADYSCKIILHAGGVYNDKPSALQRFRSNFNRLSDSLKRRLAIENDDKNYTIEDVLNLCSSIGIPAVFDNLHHKLNPCSMELKEILSAVKNTWKPSDGNMKLHYSDEAYDKKGGAHSKSVVTRNFLDFMENVKVFDADVMLEVKDKEISALKCIYTLMEAPDYSVRASQLVKYKYSVMEKGHSCYEKYLSIIDSQVHMRDIYFHIDECLNKAFNEESFKNTAKYVYACIKGKAASKEKAAFSELLINPSENRIKIKNLLQRLCKKYDVELINNSYYFIY